MENTKTQIHKIILWKKAEETDKSFDEISKDLFKVLCVFDEFPNEIRPNYFSAYSKNSFKKFNHSYETVKTILKDFVNKEQNISFDNLGYRFSLFSSLENKKSFGYQILVGNKDKRFNNSIVISIPLGFDCYNSDNYNLIFNLFVKLSKAFNPYWGCIANKIISDQYNSFIDNKKPTTFYWVNYFDEDLQNIIGIEKIYESLSVFPNIRFKDNILSLQKVPINAFNKSEMDYHHQVECFFNLNNG